MVSDIKGISTRQTTGPRQGEVVRNDGRSAAATRNDGVAQDDTVELSGLAEVISTAAKALAAESPVDETRVQQLKDAIASGSYEVDPARIARKLIDADNL